MRETRRVKGVTETVIPDDHFVDVNKMTTDDDTGMKLSRAAQKLFRSAKKESAIVDARSRVYCAALRAKREGVAPQKMVERSDPPSTGEQASIFDF